MNADDFLDGTPAADDFLGEDPGARKKRINTAAQVYEDNDGGNPLVRLGRGFKAVDVLGRYLGNKVGLVSDDSLRTAAQDYSVGADPRLERVVDTINDSEGFTGTARALWNALANDPGAVAGLALEQVPTMAASLPVGGTAGVLAGRAAGPIANAAARKAIIGSTVAAGNTGAQVFPSGLAEGLEQNDGDIGAAEAHAGKKAAAEAGVAALFGPLATFAPASRLLRTGAQATRGAASEVAETVAGNTAVGQDTSKGEMVLGGLMGSVMDLPEAAMASRIASQDQSAIDLARAIEADSQTLADAPTPQVVQQTVARVLDQVARAPAQPAAVEPAAPPALPYDPSVKSGDPDIMVAGPEGVRPMTADEFLQAEDVKQQGQDSGLTPDVQRAQDVRAQGNQPDPAVETPELVRQLMARGWKPPEDSNASTTEGRSTTSQAPAADPARAPGGAADQGAPSVTGGVRPAGDSPAAANPALNNEPSQAAQAARDQASAPARGDAPGAASPPAASRSAADVEADGLTGRATDAEPPRAQNPPQDAPPAPAEKIETEPAEQFSRAGRAVEVEGRRRPIENSKGQPVGATFKEQQNFWKWAGDTKVVDEQGRPEVMYHGTDADFNEFTPDKNGLIFVTPNQEFAGKFAQRYAGVVQGGENVLPLYAKADRPFDPTVAADRAAVIDRLMEMHPSYVMGSGERALLIDGRRTLYNDAVLDETLKNADSNWAFLEQKSILDTIERAGFDAVYVIEDGVKNLAVFDSAQLKSATGNQGAFDAADPDIRKSEATEQQPDTSTADSIRSELRERFGDIIPRLEKRGFLKLWDSTDDYNRSGQSSQQLQGAVQGMYSRGVAHLFGNGIEPGKAVAVFLHEVGEHASMKKMLGEERYRDLVRRAYRLASDGDEIAEIAMMRIPDDTPAKFQDSEMLAYLIEEAASRDNASPGLRKWLADVVAAVKAWFFQSEFGKKLESYGIRIELTPKDIAALAERAVQWQAKQGEQNPTPAGVPLAQASMRQAYGSDQVKQIAQEFIGKPLTNTSTGIRATVSGGALRKMLSSSAVERSASPQAHMFALGNIDKLFEMAQLEMSRAPRNPEDADRVKEIHHFVAPLPFDGREMQARIMAKEFTSEDQGTRLYLVQAVEIVTPASLKGESSQASLQRGPHLPAGVDGILPPPGDDVQLSRRGTNPAQAAAATFGNQPSPNTVASAAQPWTVAEPGTWDNVVRTLQNSKIDLKRVRESIEERFGRIPEQTDAYLQEELYHGRVAARVEKLHTESIEPILRKIAVSGVTLDEVNSYLHARHAPERNAAMKAINPNMANNDALSGMSDTDAARILGGFGAKTAALRAIVKDIDQLLADTRTNLVADGLEDAGVVQAWEQAYQHYVPLMRDPGDKPAKGQGFSVRGPEAKRAMGSNKAAVNILANIVTQAETAAIRAEKAEVGRSLLAMAKQYPNPDFWKVDTPPTKPRVGPKTGLVERSAVDPMYQTADNVVMVKEYGATRFIVFNKDNERAAEMAKAMKNLEIQQVPKVIEYIGKATRFMASLLTQRNPEFWFTNFARDLQGSAIQMSGTDAEGLQKKVLANLPKAMAGMRHVARETGKRTQWAKYAQELKDAGGTTGYMQMFENSDARMKDLQKEVDRMQQGKADPRKLVRQLIDFIDDYNDVVENGMRLAVFQAARDSGVSTQRAASIAKNITVNFNRKGNATPFVNSLYMFFNAGIQGTARLAQALATSNKARIAVGGLAGAAFVMDMVNRELAGEDDETKRNRYDLIPEFEKSRNWIVMGPDGKYVKVPLPLGFHVFHNAGRLLSDAMGRKDPRNASEYGWAFASTLIDAFSPVGSVASVGQLISPSVADPVVQLAENKSFTGGPVYRSDDRGFGKTDPKPAYTRHFDSTPDFWKAASRTLNDITGGDKDKRGAVNVEPDILRHIWGALTGGPGRALDRTVDATQATARGEDVSPSRLPFASRFYGENDDRQKDRAYYEDLHRAARAKEDYDHFMKVGRRDLALEVVKELGEGDPARGRKVIAEFERSKKDGRAINKRLRQLREDDVDDSAQTEQLATLKKRRQQRYRQALENTAAEE